MVSSYNEWNSIVCIWNECGMWVPSGISLWARIYCIYCTYVKGETANYIFETVPVLCVHQHSKPATMTHLVNGVTAAYYFDKCMRAQGNIYCCLQVYALFVLERILFCLD